MNPFADEACSHASSKILAFGDIVWHFEKFLLSCTLKSAICGQTCRPDCLKSAILGQRLAQFWALKSAIFGQEMARASRVLVEQ